MIKKVAAATAAAGGLMLAGAGVAAAGQGAQGAAGGLPATASGNGVGVPADAPVNVCGNTTTVLGGLNTADGITCRGD
jgi:hypothetical protein